MAKSKYGSVAPDPEKQLDAELQEVTGQAATQQTDTPAQTTAVPAESAEPTIPDHLQGKSTEELAKMYLETEQKLSRQGNELGQLRSMADNFLKQDLQNRATQQAQQRAPEISADDFLEKPVESVDDRISQHPKLRMLENQVVQQEIQRKYDQFQKTHPDFHEVGTSAEFQNWVNESEYRRNMFQKADLQYDFGAAAELLNMFKDLKNTSEVTAAQQQQQQKREETLKKATTLSASSGETGKTVYRRADLMELKKKNPDRYNALADEILKAYAEKRVR